MPSSCDNWFRTEGKRIEEMREKDSINSMFECEVFGLFCYILLSWNKNLTPPPPLVSRLTWVRKKYFLVRKVIFQGEHFKNSLRKISFYVTILVHLIFMQILLSFFLYINEYILLIILYINGCFKQKNLQFLIINSKQIQVVYV